MIFVQVSQPYRILRIRIVSGIFIPTSILFALRIGFFKSVTISYIILFPLLHLSLMVSSKLHFSFTMFPNCLMLIGKFIVLVFQPTRGSSRHPYFITTKQHCPEGGGGDRKIRQN